MSHGAVQASGLEEPPTMADKSPRQHLTKKTAGKSLKEKRLDKKAKAASSEIIPTSKKG